MSTMRIGGLASGMDIDSLVEKLMMAERAPLDKLEQKKQTYEWQRDAYRNVNSKLFTFDTYISDNLILKSFNSKTASSTNSNLVSAVATGSASGTLSIEGVSQLATSARSIGTLVSDKNGLVAKGSTKISDISGSSFLTTDTTEHSILLKSITKDGTMALEATEIKFKSTDTIDDLIKKINSSTAGVTAFFENGKLSLTAKNTGQLKDVSAAEVQLVDERTKDGVTVDARSGNQIFNLLGAGSSNDLVNGGQNALLRVNGIDIERSSNTFILNGYSVNLNETFNKGTTLDKRIEALDASITTTNATITQLTDKINNQLIGEEEAKKDAYEAAMGMFEGEDKNTDLSTKIKSIFASMTYNQIAELDGIDLNDDDAINASSTLTLEQKEALKGLEDNDKIAINGYNDLAKFKNIKEFSSYENLNAASKNLLSSMTDDADITKLVSIANLTSDTDIDLSALTDEQKGTLKALLPEQREILDSLIRNNAEAETDMKGIRNVINTKKEYDAKNLELTTTQAQLTTAQNQKAEYEAQRTAAVTAKATVPAGETAVPAVNLNSTTNVDEIMTKIKDFIKTYNGLVTELNNMINEDKYRDYKPLTKLQKEELEDREVELWEKKAKSGLLRGDSIIRNGLSSMRSLVYQSNPAITNTKYNTLYNIGITTTKDTLSGGTLEIDEAKLKKALEEDPEAVTQLFTNPDGKEKVEMVINNETKTVDTRGFLQKLRANMNAIKLKIEDRAGRANLDESQFTLGKNLRDVDKNIKTWQEKLTTIESRYWKQFSAMETMINKSNQQSAMLMGQFYQ